MKKQADNQEIDNHPQPFDQAALDDMRKTREKEYDRVVDRLERFERRASGRLTSYNELEKHTVWLEENGDVMVRREPIGHEEKNGLDEAFRITEEYERDYDLEPWDSFEPPTFSDEIEKDSETPGLELPEAHDMAVRLMEHEGNMAEWAKYIEEREACPRSPDETDIER